MDSLSATLPHPSRSSFVAQTKHKAATRSSISLPFCFHFVRGSFSTEEQSEQYQKHQSATCVAMRSNILSSPRVCDVVRGSRLPRRYKIPRTPSAALEPLSHLRSFTNPWSTSFNLLFVSSYMLDNFPQWPKYTQETLTSRTHLRTQVSSKHLHGEKTKIKTSNDLARSADSPKRQL